MSGTELAAIITAVTTAVLGILALWRQDRHNAETNKAVDGWAALTEAHQEEIDRLHKRLDECERKRAETLLRLTEVERKCGLVGNH